MQLLRIDASSRIEQSDSRNIADAFVAGFKEKHPTTQVVVRDIVQQPIPHIQQDTITGFYTPADAFTDALSDATQLSDLLINELTTSDVLLLSTPMYNFGPPSALKAWIDQIVRINKTFGVAPDNSFYGMIDNVKAYVITSAGAVYSNQPMKAYDFLSTYISTVLGLIGITDVTLIPLEGTTLDPTVFEASKNIAHTIIKNL